MRRGKKTVELRKRERMAGWRNAEKKEKKMKKRERKGEGTEESEREGGGVIRETSKRSKRMTQKIYRQQRKKLMSSVM